MKKQLWKSIFQYLIILVLAFIFLFPVLWAVLSSFKTEQNVVAYPPQIIPNPIVYDNYLTVISRYPFMNWMFNSLIITIGSTLLVLAISSLAAYPFARMNFKYKKPIFALITAMMLIPIQGYMIPLFKILSEIGMRTTTELSSLSLVLTAGANITSLFILTSFFKELPMSLEEAAKIDGCSEFRFFAVILIPLSKTALSSVAILTFISNWNTFLWPSIMLSGDKNLTLPVGMARYFGAAANDAAFKYGPSLAAACMAVLPTIVVFLILQRYFVEGIASSGIKG